MSHAPRPVLPGMRMPDSLRGLGVSPPGMGHERRRAAQLPEGHVPPLHPWGWGFPSTQLPNTRSEPGSLFSRCLESHMPGWMRSEQLLA